MIKIIVFIMKMDLHNLDCMTVLEGLEDNCIDLIITSPPYNLGYYNVNDPTKNILVKYNTYEDNLNYDDYIDWQVTVLDECYRILKPTGLLYYNHKERHYHGFYFNPLQILLQTKFNMLQTIIWDRLGGVNFNIGRYPNQYESIYVAYKTKDYMKIDIEAEKRMDIWRMKPDHNPCQIASFPLELPDYILKGYKDYGVLTVLDPFMGSGTTALACRLNHHEFIGCEIDEDSYNYAKKRVNNYQSRLI